MNLHLITFSPTHTSLTIAQQMAEGFARAEDSLLLTDLTLPQSTPSQKEIDGVALFTAPVYGGRVAERAVERFRSIRAAVPGQTPALVAVLYGNRDYEDALIELCDLVREQGFLPIAAGAFVGEHSYSRPDEGQPVAAGRPDDADCTVARRLGKQTREKYDQGNTSLPAVRGNRPYKVKGAATPATPITLADQCTGCGTCVEVCPTGVVSLTSEGIAVSTPEDCIKCCACLKFCPSHARRFDTPYTERLFLHFSTRREPELFV